ncbi:MAG TPA: pyridoxal 5'-phosphate synthase glutaminase subunit PdxT [Lachnospiraceae bacterium]|nr:pyridoxal 5'-phosphate synthase glutaminase subunit PdxT [Lachnospiraceae bacterium]
MKVAVLALQGAFIEHEKILNKMGIDVIELRKKEDLNKHFDGLILPGGESTVQGKLLREFDMFDTIQDKIKNGMPVLATCAGCILLAEKISNDSNVYFKTLPVEVKRNAYGRQLGSFRQEENIKDLGSFPMNFIRAPYIEKVWEDVEILAKVDEKIVAVRYKNQIAVCFHPELVNDFRIHQLFINSIAQCNENKEICAN